MGTIKKVYSLKQGLHFGNKLKLRHEIQKVAAILISNFFLKKKYCFQTVTFCQSVVKFKFLPW